MASENLQIDENGRNVLGAITNDASEFIKNLRVNPITGALVCEAVVTSSNTQIGSTIPGGTAGSILFLGIGSTLAEDNNNLFYDDTNNFVGLGTNTPGATLDIEGTLIFNDGSPTASFVLTCQDNLGTATWEDLSQNSTFVTNLIANSTFTTNLANNSNFYTTLSNNNSFVTNLTNNSTFETAITNITVANGAIDVQDEGVTLATAAGVLNFVGAGVIASGTGTTKTITIPGGSAGGTVTSVSVVSTNGFAGSVATSTTTPAITLSTTITGVLKGNGTAISAASAGTDYVVPGSITSDGITMNTARLLGRTTASSGAIEEITVGTGLSLSAGSLVSTAGNLSLETDGTPNGDQTLLNLVAGTNVNLTDNGTGSVTIDATGVSGNGFITQDIPLVAGTTTYTDLITTANSDGSILIVTFVLSGIINLFRLVKDSLTGNYYLTHTGATPNEYNGSGYGVAVVGNYVYVTYVDGSAVNKMKRFDLADLTNLTSMTVSGTFRFGQMWSDGTDLYIQNVSAFDRFTISGTTATNAGTVTFTSINLGKVFASATNLYCYSGAMTIQKYAFTGGAIISTTSFPEPIIDAYPIDSTSDFYPFLGSSTIFGFTWRFFWFNSSARTGVGIHLMGITLP